MIGIERKNHTLLTLRSLWLDEWWRIVAGFKNSNTIKNNNFFIFNFQHSIYDISSLNRSYNK